MQIREIRSCVSSSGINSIWAMSDLHGAIEVHVFRDFFMAKRCLCVCKDYNLNKYSI